MHTFIEPSVRRRWRERDESHNLWCVPHPSSRSLRFPAHVSRPVTTAAPFSRLPKHPRKSPEDDWGTYDGWHSLCGGPRCAQNSIFPRKNPFFHRSLPLHRFSTDSLKNSPLTAASFCDKSIAPFRLCSITILFRRSPPSIFHFSSMQFLGTLVSIAPARPRVELSSEMTADK